MDAGSGLGGDRPACYRTPACCGRRAGLGHWRKPQGLAIVSRFGEEIAAVRNKKLNGQACGSQALVPLYRTARGRMYVGKIEEALSSRTIQKLAGKVSLIFTSPPFPLV